MKLTKLRSPINVHLTIADKCNQYCNFCYVNSGPSKRIYNTNKIKKVLDECANADVFNITLYGGEPFIHPDILDITKYAHDCGFYVVIISNGTLINKNKIEKIKDYIEGIGISIHGFEDTHNSIVGGNFYNKALKAVESINQSGLSIGLNYTLTKQNKEEMIPFLKYMIESYKINTCIINRYVPLGRGNEELEPTVEQFNEAYSKLLKLKGEYPNVIFTGGDAFPYCLLEEKNKEIVGGGCSAGVSLCEINGDGDLKICAGFSKPIGNIFEEPLEEIWQENEIIEKYRNLELNISDYCIECNEFKDCLGGCRASSDKGDVLLKHRK